MIKRKYKPDKTFTMKNDGFFGELYISTDNIFNGKCIIAFGGSEGNFLLTQLCADKLVFGEFLWVVVLLCLQEALCQN